MFLYKNFIVLISSPSGAGKTSIIDELRKRDERLKFSVSATTRKPRENEIEGKHYYFLDPETFNRKVENNEFLEDALVFGNHYGTPMSEIKSKFENNFDVIMDVDWQGAQKISKKMAPSELLKIFILPPSMDALEERLKKRNSDDPATVAKRINEARNEIEHFSEYNYILVNDNFEETVSRLEALIVTKRTENVLKKELSDFVHRLLEGGKR
jgi:guanylate kinase